MHQLKWRAYGVHKVSQVCQSIGNEVVERVTNCKFLGVTVAENLSWGINATSAIGKAQQHLFYLRKVKSAKLHQQLMVNFYDCAISSILTHGFIVWSSSCTKAEQQVLQGVVKTAGKVIGTSLLEISTIYTTHCLHRVHNILRDQHHPAHHLFHLLPSGRRYRSICARTPRLVHSLYPQAAWLMNEQCTALCFCTLTRRCY